MCLIGHIPLEGRPYLAKNRDRYYITPLKVVRKRHQGVEILYILDTKSGWIEGMNEHGICLVNSVLPTTREEKIIKSKETKVSTGAIDDDGLGNDGTVIYNALCQTRLQDAVSILLRCSCRKTVGLHGHTIVTDGRNTVALEYTDKSYPRVKLLRGRRFRANHGLELKWNEGGYNPKLNRLSLDSSHIRVRKAREYMRDVERPEEILPRLAYVDMDHLCNSVFRIGKRCDEQFKFGFATTSQVMMDPTTRTVTMYIDPHTTVYEGEDNQLGTTDTRVNLVMKRIERQAYPHTILKAD